MGTVAATILGFALLLALIAPLPPLAARLRLPYTVLLALLGCGLGIAIGLADRLEPGPFDLGLPELLQAIAGLEVSSTVFLWVFLPLILFDSAIELDSRSLLEDIGPVFLMAVVAVVATTAVAGLTLWSVTAFSLAACLLVGAIIATTDPIAVINVFKEVGAPRRLVNLVEGESLLNDAAAIAITSSLLAIVIGLSEPPSLETVLASFGLALAGGALFGIVTGRLAGALLARLDEAGPAEITLSVALAYLTYAVAEIYLGFSGVVAVVAAGIVFGSQGRAHLSRGGWHALSSIWTQLSFWASSLIFVLAAMLAPRTMASASLIDLGLLLLLVASALLARALMLYGALPLMEMAGLAARVQSSYKHVMLWGGLRGAITLALALAVTENPLVPEAVQHLVAVLATGFVLFTLLVQATTLRWLMRWLGLDRLTPLEEILRQRAIALTHSEIIDTLRGAAAARGLDPRSVDVVALEYQQADSAGGQPVAEELQRRQLVTALLTLSSREAELYAEERARQMIPRTASTELVRHVGSLIDALRTEGLDGYRRVARAQLGLDRRTRLAVLLHRTLRINRPLARRLTTNLEQNLARRYVLKELLAFNAARVVPLFGERVAEVAGRFLESRLELVERAIEALQLQYPEHWRSFGERYLRLAALRLEYAAIEDLESERLLPPQVANKLTQTLRNKRSRLDRPPPLDLGLRTEALISQMPLFSKLGPRELKQLAKKLQTRLALPGERIVRRGEPGDEMFFIGSGAVEVRVQPEPIRLGTGEFFGELALLTGRLRSADVVAIGYCRLLVLRRELFDDVLGSHSTIGRSVRAAAQRRDEAGKPSAA
jgi:monovalent cation:H+ antiporter, CPA1 family